MTRMFLGMTLIAAFALGTGCKRDSAGEKEPSNPKKTSHDDHAPAQSADDGHEHNEGDGHDHAEHAHEDDHGHGHNDEADLGTVAIGDTKATVAQGHGPLKPGKETHLIVKLPYSDRGATVVRAWVGTKDRTLSLIGKGEYVLSHDEYSVHALVPNPMPANVMWWIEVEKPNGKKAVGSVNPMLD